MAGFGALLHLYMFSYIACTIAAGTVYKCFDDFEIRKALTTLNDNLYVAVPESVRCLGGGPGCGSASPEQSSCW